MKFTRPLLLGLVLFTALVAGLCMAALEKYLLK